jgi:DNA polymerase IIIc chi subunit
MAVRPDYFSWSAEQQEYYGANISEEEHALLRQALRKQSGNRTFPAEHEQMLLPLLGVGEDDFHLDEPLSDGRTVLELGTLRKLDEVQFETQEEIRLRAGLDYAHKPYRGSLYLTAAQLRIDGRFARAKLTMAAGYLYAKLCDSSHQLLEERIPFRYVPGRNHGRIKGKFWQWDMRVEAHGLESVVEELQRRIWNYERQRFDALLRENDAATQPCVYLVDESNSQGARVHFVFTNKEALSSVRFRSFVRDCRALERSTEELAEAVNREKDLMARFMDEEHAEVMSTYSTKVARFREMPKIAMMRGRLRSA